MLFTHSSPSVRVQNIKIMYMTALLFFLTNCVVIVPQDSRSKGNSNKTSSQVLSDSGAVKEKISIKLERPPIYAYPGIITDFLIQPAYNRTQSQIQNMFTYQFSEKKYLPYRMYISQGVSNNQIRVVFDYKSNIPYRPFVVTFKVKDQKFNFGEGRISMVYDSIQGGITSALKPDDKYDDVLR